MEETTMMYLDEETLTQVTSDICTTMLGLPMYPVYDGLVEHTPLTAQVRISGEWNATVEIATTPKVATLIAAQMFSLDPSQIQTADLYDALGEVANMVGGNVKGIVNGELDLSLPSVSERDTKTAVAVGETTVVQMICLEGPLIVTLSESN
jgi:chemotaxis protein CheX